MGTCDEGQEKMDFVTLRATTQLETIGRFYTLSFQMRERERENVACIRAMHDMRCIEKDFYINTIINTSKTYRKIVNRKYSTTFQTTFHSK